MYSTKIAEEELKKKVAEDYFSAYDSTRIIGKIDFCITENKPENAATFLWAEAKAGKKKDIYESLTQLVLTIGRARTFEKETPPAYIGAFDAEKIAFLPYHSIMDIFNKHDFNWNVPPSDHSTAEFKEIYDLAEKIMLEGVFKFKFGDPALKTFIKNNFKAGQSDTVLKEINKNNFVFVYNKWRVLVRPTIAVRWEEAKKMGLLDADFYLADLLSQDNATLREKLFVLLKSDHYEFDRDIDGPMGTRLSIAEFKDKQIAHKQFWNIYKRPPKEEYWDYIVARRDMLVPQDIRERKGSFYTPGQWVELSQKYLADALGDNWQEEYTIWDCAAGTGNLLAGLTNKYNIYASTIDKADVDVMRDRIKNGANLLEKHVFQFDFLNDPLDSDKIPESLRKILNDPAQRQKLLIYINPPYAEVSSMRYSPDGTRGKKGVHLSKVHQKYSNILETAGREVFAQFLIRIYKEIPHCTIAQFSKLKLIQGSAFINLRDDFPYRLLKSF